MSPAKLAGQPPSVIVLIDRQPGMDFQADFMAVRQRLLSDYRNFDSGPEISGNVFPGVYQPW